MLAPKLPIFPRFRGSWSQVMVQELDKWVQELRVFLLKTPNQSTIDVVFQAPDVPSAQFGSVSPLAVWCGGFYRMDDAGPVAESLAAPLGWSWSAGTRIGTLSFPSVTGLTPGQRYVLTAVIQEAR